MMQGGPLMHCVAAQGGRAARRRRRRSTRSTRARSSPTRRRSPPGSPRRACARSPVAPTPTSPCIDLQGVGVTGTDAETRCDAARITLNKNAIPYDPQPPIVGSGIRVGTPRGDHPGHDRDRHEGDRRPDRPGRARRRRLRRPPRSGRPWRALVAAYPAYPRGLSRQVREYLLILLVAATLHLPRRAGLVRAGAIRAGVLAEIRDRDVHDVPIPRLGGRGDAGRRARRASLVAGQAAAAAPQSSPPATRSAARAHRRCRDLPGRGGRRHLGAGRGRPSWPARSSRPGLMALQGVAAVLAAVGGPAHRARPDIGDAHHRARRGRHRQRGQLRRRAGRTGRRGRRHRRRRVLRCSRTSSRCSTTPTTRPPPLLISAVLVGVCAGLPAAQLQPGPDLHGRLRLDADRAAAGRPARSR